MLGLRVRYVDFGPTAPDAQALPLPLLLIPGHTSRIEEYDGIVPVLARRRRVVVLDHPGSGFAEKPDIEYSLRLYEDVSTALLDELGIGRAHLAGGSLGGNLVLRLGHRYPDRFERLAPFPERNPEAPHGDTVAAAPTGQARAPPPRGWRS